MKPDAVIRVLVVVSPEPRKIEQEWLDLPQGSTVAQALEASALCRDRVQRHMVVALWSRKVAADRVLEDGDRIELCRPLRVDPKVARRERFNKQGSRSAGLFASRRPGAKQGY